MAPSQALVGQEPERKEETTMQVSPDMKNMSSLENQDDKVMRCMSNCEDTTFDMDTLLDQPAKALEEAAGDVDVDIVECVNSTDIRFAEADDPDATEYSSSFCDTISETEDGSRLSDAEVESQFCGGSETFSTVFDGFNSVFRTRKKKLTAHWRKYIRPLMWRCKWVELRIKELQSQALKYEKELAVYDKRKQIELGQFGVEGSAARSLPFYRQSCKIKFMKRRKRKRLESTDDIPSYMARHSLFSYYENKRSDADAASLDDDCGNQVIAANQNTTDNDEFGVNEWSSLEFRDDENSLEYILSKIEVVQSRVHELKTRLQKVVPSNAERFSSMENLSLLVPSDVPTSSAPSPTISPGNGDTTLVGRLYTARRLSECDIGDLVVPVSAVSSYGEAAPLPDIIESTVGLLSAADGSLDQPQVGDSCDDIVDDVLIHNKAAQEELNNFGSVNTQPIEKPQEIVKEQDESTSDPSLPEMEPELSTKADMAKEQLNPKFGIATKNKRKRGERKAGSGNWSRRSSGDPEN